MLVITAGTTAFRSMIQQQQKICGRYGYSHKAYDLGGLGFGDLFKVDPADLAGTVAGDSIPPTTFKTHLAERCYQEGEILCWLDGDCIPLRDFQPEGVWDIAVTLRSLREVGASGIRITDYLNAGVLWINNRTFIEVWKAEARRLNNDQAALNEIVGGIFTVDQWRHLMGQTFRALSGFTVKVMDAMEWNCWHLPPTEQTRILHFKRGIRGAAEGYINK